MYKTREEVENWLIEMGIKNYVINEDLTVDVNNNVYLPSKNLKKIPIQFRIIKGDFYCSHNELTSLEGCPKIINSNFFCANNKLTDLKGCPEVINGNFDCSENNLTSLEGCPIIVYGTFFCFNNKLTDLIGCPEVINGTFSCNNNELTSLKYFPKEINGGNIYIKKNKIKEEELVNFNCKIKNVGIIDSDFNEKGNKEEFLEKVYCYKSKKENELLKELSVNSNNVKLNKKL